MKSFVIGLSLTLFTVPALASEQASRPLASPQARTERVDALFADLKRARTPEAAERVAGRIREEWQRSGSASVDLMMRWAGEAMAEDRNDVALDFLDQLVVVAPDYAEAWNRRATLHYMTGDTGKSLVDIERTLRIEPRHFGALSGMAQILKDAGHPERALEAYLRVLDIYPQLRSAQDEAGSLADEIAGEGI